MTTHLRSGPFEVELYDTAPAMEEMLLTEHLLQEASEYEAVGLEALAQRDRWVAARTIFGKGHRLTPEELAVWRWRYPSVYRFFPGKDELNTFDEFYSIDVAQTVVPWKELLWPLPQEVRTLLAETITVFERVEIWTPELLRVEPTASSPILVGVNAGDHYLLARWAEALEPWESLVQKSASPEGRLALRLCKGFLGRPPRWEQDCTIGSVLCLLFVLAGVGLALKFGPWLLLLAAIFSGLSLWLLTSPTRFHRQLDEACRFAGWVLPNGRD